MGGCYWGTFDDDAYLKTKCNIKCPPIRRRYFEMHLRE